MKSKLLFCLALVLCGGLFGCATQQNQNDKSPAGANIVHPISGQWEYMTMTLPCDSNDIEKQIVSDGWMLVSIQRGDDVVEPIVAQAPAGKICTYTFKRFRH